MERLVIKAYNWDGLINTILGTLQEDKIVRGGLYVKIEGTGDKDRIVREVTEWLLRKGYSVHVGRETIVVNDGLIAMYFVR